MIGQVIYKDGTSEPIIRYSQRPGSCEVITPFGKYAYQECIREHEETGYKYRSYAFFTYLGYPNEWKYNNNIKEFHIMEG